MFGNTKRSVLEPIKFRIITNGIEFALEYLDTDEWRRVVAYKGGRHVSLVRFSRIKEIEPYLKQRYGDRYTIESRT